MSGGIPRTTTWRSESLRLFLVISVALGFGFLLTLMISKDPLAAYGTLLTGGLPTVTFRDGWPVFSRMTRFGAVLEDTITLAFLGLAVAIPFKARQFSLGSDGQMFLGALAAAIVSVKLSGPSFVVIPAACLAAATTGMLYGLLPGFLKVRFGANEIVTTLMLNIVGVQLYRLIISEFFKEEGSARLSAPVLPDSAMLSILINRTHVTSILFLAVAAGLIAWFVMSRTTAGYEVRVVGENQAFAEQVGIPVRRTILLSFAFGGVFGGLAGFHLSNALLNPLPLTLPPGLGFEGIVVSLLARNDPRGVLISAFFYAYLRVGAQIMERSSDVSREMILVVQALIILLVVSERLLPLLRETLAKRRALRGAAA